MRKYALFALFLTFVGGDFLAFDLGLLPGLSLKNVLLYVLVVWIGLDAALRPEGPSDSRPGFVYWPLHVAFALLIVIAAFSVLVVLVFLHHPGYTVTYGMQGLKSYAIDPYLVLFVFLAGLSTVQDANWLARAMLATVLIACTLSLGDIFGLWDLGVMAQRDDGRITGPLGSSNDYGTMMAFLIPMTVALQYASKGLRRLAWTCGTMILTLMLLLCASRGAVVALAGGGFIGAVALRKYLHGRQVVRTVAAVSGLGLCIAAIFAVVYSDLFFVRLLETSSENTAFGISSGRTQIWAGALQLMVEEPWTLAAGYGWRSFLLMNPLASHNEYVEYFFNLGIVGLVLLLFIYFYVVRQAVTAVARAEPGVRMLLMGLVCGFLGVAVANLFGNLYNTAFFIWALTGVILRMARPATVSDRRDVRGTQRVTTSTASL